MTEGYRWKKKLFSEKGRALLEKLALAPWARRRRKELLELLDQLDPKIEELTAAVDQEAKKRPRTRFPNYSQGQRHARTTSSSGRTATQYNLCSSTTWTKRNSNG